MTRAPNLLPTEGTVRKIRCPEFECTCNGGCKERLLCLHSCRQRTSHVRSELMQSMKESHSEAAIPATLKERIFNVGRLCNVLPSHHRSQALMSCKALSKSKPTRPASWCCSCRIHSCDAGFRQKTLFGVSPGNLV